MKELVTGKISEEQLRRIRDVWNKMIKANPGQEWIPIKIAEDERLN